MNQDDNSNKIGVVAATLMVAGNMMGSGVFMLPANLAAIGGVAVFGWIVTCIGAIALALTFAKLSSIDPAAGGPYAYTRQASLRRLYGVSDKPHLLAGKCYR